jgi:TrmH family RNA methyltransferase
MRLLCHMRLTKEETRMVQSLHTKKGRDTHGCFVAEGGKIVAEILESPLLVQTIYHTGQFVLPRPTAAEVKMVDAEALQKISALTTAQQVVAVVRMPEPAPPAINHGWTLALDGIQNPGNLGALLRLADWFGIQQMVASPDTADLYNPKVIQGSMGSFLRTQMVYTQLDQWLADCGRTVYGALLNGTELQQVAAPKQAGVLLIGNEGAGIRPALLPLIQQPITIRRKGQAESLNAAVAAGILLQHLVG